MSTRYLVLLSVVIALTMPAVAQPAEPNSSHNHSMVPPPELEMEMEQNSSHIGWQYSHTGELVNFSAGDSLQVFPDNSSSDDGDENVTDPDDGNELPDNSTGDDEDETDHDSGSDSSSGGHADIDYDFNDTTESSEENSSQEEESTSSDEDKNNKKERKEDLFSSLFPYVGPDHDEGLYQNITGEFTSSSSTLAAVIMALGGLGAYVYRF